MQILCASHAEKCVSGSEIASLHSGRLVCLVFELRWNLDRWEGRGFSCLLVRLRQYYSIGKVLVAILALWRVSKTTP